jgi:hypothetical protein
MRLMAQGSLSVFKGPLFMNNSAVDTRSVNAHVAMFKCYFRCYGMAEACQGLFWFLLPMYSVLSAHHDLHPVSRGRDAGGARFRFIFPNQVKGGIWWNGFKRHSINGARANKSSQCLFSTSSQPKSQCRSDSPPWHREFLWSVAPFKCYFMFHG